MSKFKIELTENGVSILTQTQYYDADGNPVALGNNHRTALGLNDFPTEADFRAAVDSAVAGKLNTDLITGLANIKVAVDQTANLTADVAARDAEIVTLNGTITTRENELGARDAAILDRDNQITTLNDTLVTRNQEIGTLNATLATRDAEIVARDNEIADLNRQIAEARGGVSPLPANRSPIGRP